MQPEKIRYNLLSTPKSNSNQTRYKMKKFSTLMCFTTSCANENEIEELTIYTSRQPQLLEPIIEEFLKILVLR